MACEETVPVCTLSSLHQHCNNKIAWFRNVVAGEHHEWLSTFLADARSSLLKSSKDEPISVLPPRTPHAPRKRRCVEERRSSTPDERAPIKSPSEQTAALLSCHTPERHPSPAAIASPPLRPPALAAAEPMDTDIIVCPTPCAAGGNGHTVKFAAALPATPSPPAHATSPDAEESPASPLMPPRASPPPARCTSAVPCQEVEMDDAGAEEECVDDVVVVTSSSSSSSLTQESVHALEEETGSAHRVSSQSNDSFVTAAADLPTSLDEADAAVLMPPPSEPLPATATFTDKRATPRNQKVPLKSMMSTPVVSLTPMDGRMTRSGSRGSATSRLTHALHTSHSGTLAEDLAASPLPSCYGVRAGIKNTPLGRDAQGSGGSSGTSGLSSYVPPSAARILRSALRKHGAEADSDLQKLKSGANNSGGSGGDAGGCSGAIRFGAPLRAFHGASSPGNSDNEGDDDDDDHPKVLRRLNNIVSSVASLIPHTKTPKKMDSKAKQDKLKAELDAKAKQTEERKRKKEEQRLQELEEKKQKRAERERLNRKRKADMEEERCAKLLKKTDTVVPPPAAAAPPAASVSAAVQKKKAQELDEQRRKEQRKLELEVRRRQEEEAKAKKRAEAVKKFPAAVATAAALPPLSASSSLRLQSPCPVAAAKPKMAAAHGSAPKSVSALASRVFAEPSAPRAAALNLGVGTTPAATPAAAAGSSNSSNMLKKALSRTTPTALSAVRVGDKNTPSVASSSSQDSVTSGGSVASGSVRPVTPSCANLVKSFPSSSAAAAAIKTGVSSIAKTVGLSSSSSAPYLKQAQAAGALGPIQESGGKSTASFSSAHRSPLKSLNTTHAKSSVSSAVKAKATHSPMPMMGHGMARAGSHLVPSTPNTSYNDYGIDDIESDDPTDDEESPRRKIPKWAQQGPLKRALIDQEISGDIADQLFPVADLETPNLTRIFQRERQRYLKRTSSAIWSSPLIKRAV